MTAAVIPLPPRKPEPDTIRVARDFGRWSVEHYREGRFRFRTSFASETAARAEAERLVRERGLVLLPETVP